MSTFSQIDHRWMSRALELAARGLTTTDPNPRVGCVIASAERIVAEGWHERAGEPHAEVNALANARQADRGDEVAGATLYVTLEPCSHQGRTPPCVDAVIQSRVERVVCSMVDPNPLVMGMGIARLQSAGVKVETGLLGEESAELNCGFVRRMRTGLPWVRVKLASSLDGRTALSSGESRWISGEASRADVQQWRARSSAVLTGMGTVSGDDPRLDVRTEPGARQPLRVVLDTDLELAEQARLLDPPGEVLVFTAAGNSPRRAALEKRGARVEHIGRAGDGLDLSAVMSRLGELAINEVWVESGARLAGALLEANLVNELVVYVAPHVLGSGARGMFDLPEPAQLSRRRQFEFRDVQRIGEDVRIVARPAA